MKGDRDGKSAKTSATRHCLFSAVLMNDHMYPRPLLYHFSCFYNPFRVRNDIGTGIHSLELHYIGSVLLHSFFMISHPYPLSFHELIFILVPLIFLLRVEKLERQGALKTYIARYTRMLTRARSLPSARATYTR